MNTEIGDRLLQKISSLEGQNEDLEKSFSDLLYEIEEAVSQTDTREALVEKLNKLIGA